MQLSINEKNTIQNFASVMTDSSKVISELIQNSRRAGATEIHIHYDKILNAFQIKDNGSGIDNFENLITLSESGWNKDTQENDSPFGMGFFSTLFAADAVIVESNGQILTIDTKKALNFEDIPAPTASPNKMEQGTSITLHRFNTDHGINVSSKVFDLALYSSIDIYYNGKLQSSSLSFRHFQKNNRVVQTPFGQLVIEHPFSTTLTLVCQDLLIGERKTYSNVLYLNNTIEMRMPDRDIILNADKFNKESYAWLKTFWTNELIQIRKDMNNDVAFLDKYFSHVMTFCKSILNDINYLPKDAFRETQKYTCRDDFAADGVPKGFTKAELQDVLVHNIDDFNGSSCNIANHFFYYANAIELCEALPDDHWAYEGIFKLEQCANDDFEISTSSGEIMEYSLEYGMVGDALIVNTDVEILHKPTGKIVTVSPDNAFALFTECEGFYKDISVNGKLESPEFVIGKDAVIEDELLLQVKSYRNEFDDNNDTELSEDRRSLTSQVSAFKADDVKQILSDLIGHIPPVLQSKLAGHKLTATIENGRLIFA